VAKAGETAIHTIPASACFLRVLADFVLENAGADPLVLADTVVFFPTRRACRAFADVLTRRAPHAASLLPRLQPIGAIDEDDHVIAAEFERGIDPDDLPPAIPAVERRFALAHLVARRDARFAGAANWPAALGAATELGKVLDSFYTEEIPLDAIDRLRPENLDLAEHWDRQRTFLSVITDFWPAFLAERGQMDPAERRIALIRRRIDLWTKTPPDHPVVIAGTTGSTPAVAALMQCVAGLEQGSIFLPGVDLGLDARAWETLEDSHAQAGLKALLEQLGTERSQIKTVVPAAGESPARVARSSLIRLALRPASRTDDWVRQLADADRSALVEGLEGLSLVTAQDEDDEAAIIALMIREATEEPDQTVMLVTPDRDLTRRVSEKLRRWAIETDDSGGVPLGNTPCGTFLTLTAQWLARPSDPVGLLALLRHPLCAAGKADLRRGIKALDLGLRGLAPGPGFAGLRAHLTRDDKTPTKDGLAVLDLLEAAARPWLALDAGKTAFSERLTAHLHVAETLAGEALWSGQDGLAASLHLRNIMAGAEFIGALGAGDYPSAFTQALAGPAVRRRRPAHPRVFILGPLEARLLSADHVILGGLNEGIWPGEATVDGFLSRPMRASLGLPSPERRVGLSAHDFAQHAHAASVTLTRAERVGGAPAKPARWLVRLRTILKGLGDEPDLKMIDRSDHWRQLARMIDRPARVDPAEPPKPCPPAEARPDSLFVTRIEKLLRDPYSIYVRFVLSLRKLDRPAEPFSSRHLGSILHSVFERYARGEGEGRSALDRLCNDELLRFGVPDRVAAFMRPRLAESLDWFHVWHRAQLHRAQAVIVEEEGQWAFEIGARAFTLKARADRIDRTGDGLEIFDFKTGKIPSFNQTKTFSPQLALTGLIAEQNGFETVEGAHVARLAYLKALGRKKSNPDACLEGDAVTESIADAREQLTALLTRFFDPTTPYLSQPRPEYEDDYGDYDHLARRAEWASEGEGEQDG